MGRPSDRVEGVRLVTDYGALEWALRMKTLQENKKTEESLDYDGFCSCGVEIDKCDC